MLTKLEMAHRDHCCFKHGCKYEDDWCLIAAGGMKQEHPCSDCEDDSGWFSMTKTDYWKHASLEEKNFLVDYDPSKFPIWCMTVDMAVFSYAGFDGIKVLLIKRKNFPYKGFWAMPGGFVDPNESLSEAALRELREEAGISSGLQKMRQLEAVNTPGRDPRGNSLTVLYGALIGTEITAYAGDDAVEAEWVPLSNLDSFQIAFDHRDLIRFAYKRMFL